MENTVNDGKRVGLRQELRGWQILFILLSGVIGITIFSSGGEALEIAGPGGLLLAYCIVGIIAISVMEGVSEFVQLFPAPNAIVEYVRAFCDVDLAWVIGVAYWYTYASIYATLLIAAAEFSNYWSIEQIWQVIIFYILSPVIIVGINCAGVWWYGLIETIGGTLKVIMVFGVAVLMFVIANKEKTMEVIIADIHDGFKTNKAFAESQAAANCFAISIIAYAFLSVEMVAMTAYEARNVADLRRPSKFVAYIVLLLYLLCALGEILNVDWMNPSLPDIYGGLNTNSTTTVVKNARSRAIAVIAAEQAGYKRLPGFITGCMIFSALSASNTSLYISSRVMYGMTRELTSQYWPFTWIRKLGTTTPKTDVPGWALVVSALSFIWLPYVRLKQGIAAQELVEVMNISGSVSGLVVWASLCLAFIRYYSWLRMHQKELSKTENQKYNRWNKATSGSSTVLSYYQPVIAWLGLIGSLLIVVVFSTAQWWNGVTSATKVASAYASPIAFLGLWGILKIVRVSSKNDTHQKGLFVKLDEDSSELFRTLRRLDYKKPGVAQQSRFSRRLRSLFHSAGIRRKKSFTSDSYGMTGPSSERSGHLGVVETQDGTSGSSTVGG